MTSDVIVVTRGSHFARTFVVTVLLAFVVYLIASPYITVYQFGQAAQARDSGRVASMVDFPAVRESLKGTLGAMMIKRVQRDNNPFSALSVAIVTPMLNSLIDSMVTPAGITAMMTTGEAPSQASASSSAESTSDTSDSPSTNEAPRFQMYYVSWDRFGVDVGNNHGGWLKTRFCREALISWKLCDVQMEMPD